MGGKGEGEGEGDLSTETGWPQSREGVVVVI